MTVPSDNEVSLTDMGKTKQSADCMHIFGDTLYIYNIDHTKIKFDRGHSKTCL